MAVLYPLEFHRRSERQWQRRVKAPTQPRQDDTSTKTLVLRGFTGHAALQSIKSKMQVTSSNIVDDDYLLDGRIVKTKRNSSGYPTL
jgi:hypothetical protein